MVPSYLLLLWHRGDKAEDKTNSYITLRKAVVEPGAQYREKKTNISTRTPLNSSIKMAMQL